MEGLSPSQFAELLTYAGVDPRRMNNLQRSDLLKIENYMQRASLIAFTERMFPRYKPARYHYMIAHALEDIAHKKNHYLIITMPPRHGKSELASVHFPPWFLGNYPDERIIAVSYSSGLVNKFSRRARDIVQSDRFPFEGIQLSQSAASVTSWDIANHRGGYIAAGVGGGITGMGANVLLIDDPVKNQEEADSPVIRESIWEWFQSTALTRLEPNGSIVMIGTRWHEDDLIGRALQMEGIEWKTLYLPAEADTDDDILEREPGEWLWPERFSPEQYEQIRKRVGERNWLTQYQGRPYSDTGGIFHKDWWLPYKYGEEPIYAQRAVVSVDSAFKTGVSADYSVFALWIVDYNYDYWLLDLFRARLEFPDLIDQGYRLYGHWRPRLNVPLIMLVEDHASGQSAIQVWKRVDVERGRPPLAVQPFGSKGQSKIARADGVSPLVKARKVHIPEQAPWYDEFIQEHVAFPYGMHDDMVDTTSMALTELSMSEVNVIGAF